MPVLVPQTRTLEKRVSPHARTHASAKSEEKFAHVAADVISMGGCCAKPGDGSIGKASSVEPAPPTERTPARVTAESLEEMSFKKRKSAVEEADAAEEADAMAALAASAVKDAEMAEGAAKLASAAADEETELAVTADEATLSIHSSTQS